MANVLILVKTQASRLPQIVVKVHVSELVTFGTRSNPQCYSGTGNSPCLSNRRVAQRNHDLESPDICFHGH
jgi:hypothetical protein